ncbi:Uncharacterized lipoprotein YmbA [Marinospirillum celere]|uniref:Uncharacterized lipoprotein YmbA n=1 Tax=Marinospirillum celere TaxID=1122252 RepID=A0A1I1EFB5_9GAMM|nr:ABC-type transport auxiliary lipoprotein family protein [Marinospirillum celere]SFB85849.1 Uncharacterized lipoprotein YmbA [Marinospirillum celere]
MKPFYLLGVILVTVTMSACTLLPEPEPTPRLLQLQALTLQQEGDQEPKHQIRLAVERPLASSPLRQTDLWYQDQDFVLMPFSRHLWTESLDQQVQSLLADYLAAQSWSKAVSLDTPGFRSDYRLRVHLQHWYLDTRQEKLIISLQANLLNSQGNSLLQHQWRGEQAVTELSAPGLAQASQEWLQNWAEDLNQRLEAYWDKSI